MWLNILLNKIQNQIDGLQQSGDRQQMFMFMLPIQHSWHNYKIITIVQEPMFFLSKPITAALLTALASRSAFTTPNAVLGVQHGLSITELGETPQYQLHHSCDFNQQSSLKL